MSKAFPAMIKPVVNGLAHGKFGMDFTLNVLANTFVKKIEKKLK